MTFAAPLYLLLLPAIVGALALLLIWSEQRRRRALAQLGSLPQIRRLMEAVPRRRRWAERGLWLAATALLMVALARPQWGEEVRVVQREGVQVVIALDVSTSMLATDLKPDRLSRAKLEIADLMERLNGDEVALVLFSGASFVQFPLTSDYNTARGFLERAAPGVISQPGTNLGEAMVTATSAFDQESNAQKVLVILTDGEAHDPAVLEQAQAAADAGVRIYTIGMGSPDGAPVPQLDLFGNVVGQKVGDDGLPVISRLDEATLQEISTIGGGEYALATPSGAHLDMLEGALAALQVGSMGEESEILRIERFQLFVAAALVLLAAASLVPGRRRSRVASPQPVRPPPAQKRVVEPLRREGVPASALQGDPVGRYAPPGGSTPTGAQG